MVPGTSLTHDREQNDQQWLHCCSCSPIAAPVDAAPAHVAVVVAAPTVAPVVLGWVY